MIINQNEINTNDKIFIKATEIKKLYAQNTATIPIIFAKNSLNIVIDSLFLILLFDIQRELAKRLILDISQLTEKSQIYIQIFLTQYMDMNLKNPESGATFFNILDDEIMEYRNAMSKGVYDRNRFYLDDIAKADNIWLLPTKYLKESEKTIFDFRREYQFFPILQLRRLEQLISYRESKAIDDITSSKEENRRILYNNISLDGISNDKVKEYKDEVKNFITDSLNSLGVGEKQLALPFSNIFFELIDNIRRHTNEIHTNAHMHLSKINGEFKFIISDNYDVGFLESYRRTLICEKKKLSKKMKEKLNKERNNKGEIKNIYKRLKTFTLTINELKKGQNQKVLKELFSINKSLHTHQIPRLAMHFGIPILLKTLSKLRAKKKKYLSLFGNIFT